MARRYRQIFNTGFQLHRCRVCGAATTAIFCREHQDSRTGFRAGKDDVTGVQVVHRKRRKGAVGE